MRNEKLRGALIIALSVVLAAILLFEIVQSRRDNSRRAAHIKQLQAQVRQNEEEIERLKLELDNPAEPEQEAPSKGLAVIAWQPSDAADIALIGEICGANGVQPVIVLDCSKDIALLTELIVHAANNCEGAEIALTADTIDEAALQKCALVNERLTVLGHAASSVFILNERDDTPENRAALEDKGFSAFACWSDTFESGISESGFPYAAYTYIRSDSDDARASLDRLGENGSTLLVIYELSAEGGRLSEEAVKASVSDALAESEAYVVTDLNTAFEHIVSLADTQQQSAETAESLRAEKLQRIAELEDEITRLYASWNKY